MAITYAKITGSTLGSNQTTINIGSIPQNFTDLVLRCYLRSTAGTTNQTLQITFNSNTNTIYSNAGSEWLVDPNTINGVLQSNRSAFEAWDIAGTNYTAACFTYLEMYIPQYTVAKHKQTVGEGYTNPDNSNTTGSFQGLTGYWRSNDAISSIQLNQPTDQFAAGSSVYLYGILRA